MAAYQPRYKRKRNGDASSQALALGPYRPPRPVKRARAMEPRRLGYSGELKFHDVALDDAVVAGGGNITATVNIIPQGVTEIQRIGRKCTIRSIHWKYRVDLPEVGPVASPNTIDEVRVIMYLDKQCNGATAAATDILETATLRSFRNLANSGRFTFLCDRVHTLNWTTLASDTAGAYRQAEVVREFSFNKKCEIPIEFNAGAGILTEIRSNNIGVLLVGVNGAAGFLSSIRLRFSDN